MKRWQLPLVRQWERGEEPFLRTNLREPTGYEPNRTDGEQCPFCGESSLIRSYGDCASDDQRIEAYCTNTGCEVRKVHILGDAYVRRADLDALHGVDRGRSSSADSDRRLHLWTASDKAIHEDDRLARRRGAHIPCKCTACREAS